MSSLSVEEYTTMFCSMQAVIPEDVILVLFSFIDFVNYTNSKTQLKKLNNEYVTRLYFRSPNGETKHVENDDSWIAILIEIALNNHKYFNYRNLNNLNAVSWQKNIWSMKRQQNILLPNNY